MVVRAPERIAVAALMASLALPLSTEAQTVPVRKVELNKYTCEQFSAVEGEARDGILAYFNGYLDGTRKATIWDADQAGKRIDEVERICKASPKLTLLDAFKRAWKR